MNDREIQRQARRLRQHESRGGCVSAWLRSKDLSRRDRARILRAWRRMRSTSYTPPEGLIELTRRHFNRETA